MKQSISAKLSAFSGYIEAGSNVFNTGKLPTITAPSGPGSDDGSGSSS